MDEVRAARGCASHQSQTGHHEWPLQTPPYTVADSPSAYAFASASSAYFAHTPTRMTKTPFYNPEMWDDRLEAERRAVIALAGDNLIPDLPKFTMAATRPRQMYTAHYRTTHHVVQSSLTAAMAALAFNIVPVISARTPAERSAAWARLCQAVGVGAAVGAGVGGLRGVALESMEQIKSVVFDMSTGGAMLRSVRKMLVSFLRIIGREEL